MIEFFIQSYYSYLVLSGSMKSDQVLLNQKGRILRSKSVAIANQFSRPQHVMTHKQIQVMHAGLNLWLDKHTHESRQLLEWKSRWAKLANRYAS